MRGECCKAHIWRNGIFFSDETYSWAEVKKSAHRIQEIKYLPEWRPWNTIYRVTSMQGKEETYATYENIDNRHGRRLYRQRREQGLCVRCGEPTRSTYCMCNVCRERHREKEKRTKRAKAAEERRQSK